MQDRATLDPFAHVLAVPELAASAAYYAEVLGFEIRWAEMDGWRLAVRDGLRLMLGHCPDTPAARTTGDHSWIAYVHVSDVDLLHEEWTARGADCTPPVDKPHGFREMLTTTPDGHRFMFGQPIRGA